MKVDKVLKVATLLALLVVVACSKDEEKSATETKPVDKYDTPYSRMEDPTYVKAIDEQNAKRDDISRRLQIAREEFRAAKAKGDELLALAKSNALMKISAEFEKNRQETIKLVRARILQEQNAIKAKAAREGARDTDKAARERLQIAEGRARDTDKAAREAKEAK